MPSLKRFAAYITFAAFLGIFLGCATTGGVQNVAIKTGPVYYPQLRPEIGSVEVARKSLGEILSGTHTKTIGIKVPAIPSSCRVTDRAELMRISKGSPGKASIFCDASNQLMYAQFTSYRVMSHGIWASDSVFVDNADLLESDIVVEGIPEAETKISSISCIDDAVDNRPSINDNYRRPYRISFRGDIKFYFVAQEEAATFADNLFFIQQTLKATQDDRRASFALKASQYREAKVKPVVSEEQRRFIVQANALNQRKDYPGAVELYLKVLEVGPVAYPGAYFNLALLSAQMERYKPAISYMKQYLMLEPDSKDARSAQDKIYEWEILSAQKP